MTVQKTLPGPAAKIYEIHTAALRRSDVRIKVKVNEMSPGTSVGIMTCFA